MPELFCRIKWILCSKRSKKNENVSVARPLGEIGCSPLTLWTAVPRPASPRRAIPWMWRSVRRRWPAENLHHGREILARYGNNMKQFLFKSCSRSNTKRSGHGHSEAKLKDGVLSVNLTSLSYRKDYRLLCLDLWNFEDVVKKMKECFFGKRRKMCFLTAFY